MTKKAMETDPQSGARVYLLGGDVRPADNIYGEQPYSDNTGDRIAVRYFPQGDQPGGIAIVDLADGARRDVMSGDPRFPAFHAWGEYLYYQKTVDRKLILLRCRYDTLATDDVAVLPSAMGGFSYGAVSPDNRYYAVSVRQKDAPARVELLDLKTGQWRLLLDKPGYHAKHEQFSHDGSNRVLIQLNQQPDVKKVLLGEITIDGRERLFPADSPFTPRPTGHEAWIGSSDSVFFSTVSDDENSGNLWSAKIGASRAARVRADGPRFTHVSVSKCGRYWIGDVSRGRDVPIYMGRFGTDACKRLVFSRTVPDGMQWSHTHPYLTADNRWLIFTSNRDGHPQVYGARLAPEWLETL